MTRVKSPNPERRMGVYKRLAEVPDRYRLQNHAAAYENRDVWEEYLEMRDNQRDLSHWFFKMARKVGRKWKSHLGDDGPHHALAAPDDVEEFSQFLLANMKIRTVYEQYWVQLERFYTWLQFHPEHPHVYHPVLMAAAQGGAAERIWERKIRAGNERTREHKNE